MITIEMDILLYYTGYPSDQYRSLAQFCDNLPRSECMILAFYTNVDLSHIPDPIHSITSRLGDQSKTRIIVSTPVDGKYSVGVAVGYYPDSFNQDNFILKDYQPWIATTMIPDEVDEWLKKIKRRFVERLCDLLTVRINDNPRFTVELYNSDDDCNESDCNESESTRI